MNVKDILYLDSKRTKGDWKAEYKVAKPHYNIISSISNDGIETYISNAMMSPDSEFIAAAPLMVEIIKEQQQIINDLQQEIINLELEANG